MLSVKVKRNQVQVIGINTGSKVGKEVGKGIEHGKMLVCIMNIQVFRCLQID